ncbi:glycosyltransferase family 2 protein [Heyndrickxia sp. MSNUG]|uniref:glycosyltransferase family 2 protein n=1 Tax=Heyndrickxia sp. MSNUG TaxID=3136677 RepID=UPI003C2DC286
MHSYEIDTKLPRVTIIIPVYNSAEFISDCLESVLQQSYKNLEIIIINDGSTDNSEKIIKTYMKDKRIKYLSQSNRGPAEARNAGINFASGEYLVFIDADDTIEQLYIESLLVKIHNSKSDLVCSGYIDLSEYGIKKHIDFEIGEETSVHDFAEMVCQGTGGVLWSKIFKKEIIIKHDLQLDKDLYMSEDLVFVLRYASHCESFSMINEFLYKYNRLNQNSISSNVSIHYLENYINVCSRIEKILTEIKLSDEKITGIINKRMQETLLQLVIRESLNLDKIGLDITVQNIKRIYNNQVIQMHIENYRTQKIIYKPLIMLIKRQNFKLGIFYSFSLNKIIKFKKNLLNGWISYETKTTLRN